MKYFSLKLKVLSFKNKLRHKTIFFSLQDSDQRTREDYTATHIKRWNTGVAVKDKLLFTHHLIRYQEETIHKRECSIAF